MELSTGNYPDDAHCKLSMLENSDSLRGFQDTLEKHDFRISSLSCHGNALHPVKEQADRARDISRKTWWV